MLNSLKHLYLIFPNDKMKIFGNSFSGVVFVDGPFRHEQKKFTMNVLRKLGYGSHPMHDIIVREVQELVKIIESNCEVRNFRNIG